MSEKENNNVTRERRRFLRLNLSVNIEYSVIPDTEEQAGILKDIGAGGICLIADEELEIGRLLKIEISLPDDPPTIQTVGRIVWIKPYSIESEGKKRFDVGVEFIDITEDERKKIKKYVFSLS